MQSLGALPLTTKKECISKMFETSNEGYETYLRKRQNIIARIDEIDAILDIDEAMTRDDYDFMVQVYAGEHLGEGLTEKQIARMLAEDQTYYMTKGQAKVVQEVIKNYQDMLMIPENVRDIVKGTFKSIPLVVKQYVYSPKNAIEPIAPPIQPSKDFLGLISENLCLPKATPVK